MKHFSQIITDLMTSQHLSEQDLADQLQISVEEVNFWKKGYSVPKEETLERLSRWYGLDEKSLKKSASMREVHQGVSIAEKSYQSVISKVIGAILGVAMSFFAILSNQFTFTILICIFSVVMIVMAVWSLSIPSQPILASDKGFVLRRSQRRSVFIPYSDIIAIDYHQYRSKYRTLSYGRITIRTSTSSYSIGDIADVKNTSDSMHATLANHSSNFRIHSEEELL